MVDYKTYSNYSAVINEMLNSKHVIMYNSQIGESIAQFMNSRYSIRFHLSEQNVFLSFIALPMRKSLPQLITYQINRM